MRTTQPTSTVRADPLSTDQRYSSYVQLACNLDTILWNTQATLLGITVLSWGAIGLTVEKKLSLPPLSDDHTLAGILLLTSLLYAVTIFVKLRIRFWHKTIETELSQIEGAGYFVLRQKPQPFYKKAPTWSAVLFGAMAAGMFLFALVLFLKPDAGRQAMNEITPTLAEHEDGVSTLHEVMDNGERRFRLRTADGNGYILTRSTEGGWQKSHHHDRVAETYIVEKGWMLFATQGEAGAEPKVIRMGPGDTVTTPVGGVHNVYMGPDSEIHTVKHGGRQGERDWVAHPEFDAVTSRLPVPGSPPPPSA